MKKKIFILAIFIFGLVGVAWQKKILAQGSTGYKVGAYYFGTYSANQSFWKLDNCQTNFGRRDPWCGVKDFYGLEPGIPKNTQGWDGDYGYLKPAIGFYDSSKVETMERQIMQAKENGIDFFNFYWYWGSNSNTPDLNRGEMESDGSQTFVQAKNSQDMEFMLSLLTKIGDGDPCLNRSASCIKRSEFESVSNLLVSKYISKPNYIKSISGKPIITLFGSSTDTQEDRVAFLGLLKQKTLAAIGKEPMFLFGTMGILIPTDPPAGFDGTTCLGGGTMKVYGENDYQTYLNDLPVILSPRPSGKPYMRCLTHNFDSRPWQNVVGDRRTPPFDRSIRIWYGNYTLDRFKSVLQYAKNYLDGLSPQTDELARYVTIYAWNEWHEGGRLEPSLRDGAENIKAVAEAFGLPRGTNPCRDTGVCWPYWMGDANRDGFINLADFVTWKREFTGALTTKSADYNSDGNVNLADFVVWKKHL